MLILTLIACQPADRFFVIDNFNPGIELSDDSVAGVYAAGSDLHFGVFEAAHWGKEANLRGFTLVSGDPEVIALSSVMSSVDTIDAEATAVGGGTTTLAVIDDAGNIVHEVAVEVAVPDAVALTTKLSIDVGSGFVASAPQKVLVGSYSAFEAEFSADGRSLAAHEVLGAMGGDAVAVEVEDSTLWEDREWLSIWPTLPGGQSVAVLAAGSELAEVRFDAVDITDIVGLQVLGNVTGCGRGRHRRRRGRGHRLGRRDGVGRQPDLGAARWHGVGGGRALLRAGREHRAGHVDRAVRCGRDRGHDRGEADRHALVVDDRVCVRGREPGDMAGFGGGVRDRGASSAVSGCPGSRAADGGSGPGSGRDSPPRAAPTPSRVNPGSSSSGVVMRAVLSPLFLILPVALFACQDYDLHGKKDDPGHDLDTGDTDTFDTSSDDACADEDVPAEDVALNDACHYEVGGFTPIVEWDVPGKASDALPVVGDLDGDGIPEIVVNWAFLGPGELAAYHGDGSGMLWQTSGADTGFGAHPAIADIDNDGLPEVLVVREYASELFTFGSGQYSVVAYSWDGVEILESDIFSDDSFDYATGITVSDMDHDGSPEVIAGRAVLHNDLTTRAIGTYGRGCPAYTGFGIYGEGAQPAVVDLDLDGQEEILSGDVMYDADGQIVARVSGATQGATAVGNFDSDPEGEFVRVSGTVIQAYDTDGSVLWGPLTNPSANIFPIPAVGDIDGDGLAEIIVAGGNALWALNSEDGSQLWTARVQDMSGATGASIFDFDADGVPEVVYIDEVEMVAYNGADGVIKFLSNEHASATMYDYPVIADVDADGHAEIVVVHDAFSSGMSIYGDATDSWAPARKVWNQHDYTITNINDDLSVPVTAIPNFTVYNSFHSALAVAPGATLDAELEGDLIGVCTDDCDRGTLHVVGRAKNTGGSEVPAGIIVALYGRGSNPDILLATATIPDAIPSGRTSAGIAFDVNTADLDGVDSLWLVVDDDGTGTGAISECLEDDNGFLYDGELCP